MDAVKQRRPFLASSTTRKLVGQSHIKLTNVNGYPKTGKTVCNMWSINVKSVAQLVAFYQFRIDVIS